jgi:hypothetical protein
MNKAERIQELWVKLKRHCPHASWSYTIKLTTRTKVKTYQKTCIECGIVQDLDSWDWHEGQQEQNIVDAHRAMQSLESDLHQAESNLRTIKNNRKNQGENHE